MAALRTKIPDFELANPQYVGALVSFFGVDINGASTGVLANLYAAPTGSTTVTNPQTLDSEGKFSAPVYIEDPVIAEVTGANVGSQTTGVISPLRGTWRGDWVTGTTYRSNDEFRDPLLDDLYVVRFDHVAGASIAADLLAGKIELIFSFSDIDADAASIAAAVATTNTNAAASSSSAAAAATSETNSATSATNAATSETNAAASKTAAETASAQAVGVARGFNIINGTIVESHAGNAVTFAIKTFAGADPSAGSPVMIVFPTSAGGLVMRTLTAALSLTLSSGSTIGAASNVPFKVWIVAFDDAGTVRLGAINCLSGNNIYPLGQYPFATSTAEGGAGAADNPHTFYTGTAVANKAYCVLAYCSWESGLVTAGIWNASPTRLLMYQAGMPLPGAVIQSLRSTLGTGGSQTINPSIVGIGALVTQAFSYVPLTQTITPTSAANLLEISHIGTWENTIGQAFCAVALFKDSGDAIATQWGITVGSQDPLNMFVAHSMLAGQTTSTTFKAGFCPVNGGASITAHINDVQGATPASSPTSFLHVKEIMT
jgi:hypothetical protein